MTDARHITIIVRYDGQPRYGRSLAWIAPELRGAALALTDDRLDSPSPSRSWAGVIDGPTFERLAGAWRLADVPSSPRTYVLDGMNWEAEGWSPIVCVTVEVRDAHRAQALHLVTASYSP